MYISLSCVNKNDRGYHVILRFLSVAGFQGGKIDSHPCPRMTTYTTMEMSSAKAVALRRANWTGLISILAEIYQSSYHGTEYRQGTGDYFGRLY